MSTTTSRLLIALLYICCVHMALEVNDDVIGSKGYILTAIFLLGFVLSLVMSSNREA